MSRGSRARYVRGVAPSLPIPSLGPTAVVVFDLDGVLVDSRKPIAGSINYALRAHGHQEHEVAALAGFIGPPLHLAFAELLDEDRDSDAVAACVASYRENYSAASLAETKVFAGIPEVLAELSQTRRLAVATSKPLALAEPLLEALRLRDYFDVVRGPDLSAAAEDKSTTVRDTLKALGARQGAMIGDRSFDVLAAREHGLVAVGATWGIGSTHELHGAGADVLVSEPADLLVLFS